ncbi:hypothetical protein [Marinobacter salicampi]|uniref:hypothetical protein n=1 Tax=Marinobacter salicampi TaxID=435907 RepID=UPI001408B7DA|nr:hypothetical protein [Marinobacter salicampi]
MDIVRTTPVPLTEMDPRHSDSQRTPRVDTVKAPPRERLRERRRQPDRRRKQMAFDGEDRRKRRSRRSPILLDHRTAKPAALEDRRGSLISTRV